MTLKSVIAPLLHKLAKIMIQQLLQLQLRHLCLARPENIPGENFMCQRLTCAMAEPRVSMAQLCLLLAEPHASLAQVPSA